MDAGPQVKIICQSKEVAAIKREIEKISKRIVIDVCRPGKDAKIIKNHLF
jgi:mevalonate pyrophosphate decarboxylase